MAYNQEANCHKYGMPIINDRNHGHDGFCRMKYCMDDYKKVMKKACNDDNYSFKDMGDIPWKQFNNEKNITDLFNRIQRNNNINSSGIVIINFNNNIIEYKLNEEIKKIKYYKIFCKGKGTYTFTIGYDFN